MEESTIESTTTSQESTTVESCEWTDSTTSTETSETQEETTSSQIVVPTTSSETTSVEPVTTTQATSVEFITEDETYSLPEQRVPSDQRVIGDEKIIQQAIDGIKRHTYLVIYTDGIETGRELISTETVQEAQAQITEYGTAQGQVFTREKQRRVSFKETRTVDPSLAEGDIRIDQEGQVGIITDTIKYTYINGKLTEEIISSQVTTSVVDRIMRVGSMPVDEYNQQYTRQVTEAMTQALNELRMLNGFTTPLVKNDQLQEAATRRSDENSENNKMGHNYTIDGQVYSDKLAIREAGYPEAGTVLIGKTNLAMKQTYSMSDTDIYEKQFGPAQDLGYQIINDWYLDAGETNLFDGHRKVMLTPFMEDTASAITFKKTFENGYYFYRYDATQMYGTTEPVDMEEFYYYLAEGGYMTETEVSVPTNSLPGYDQYLTEKIANTQASVNNATDPVKKEQLQARLDELQKEQTQQEEFNQILDPETGSIAIEELAIYENHRNYYEQEKALIDQDTLQTSSLENLESVNPIEESTSNLTNQSEL